MQRAEIACAVALLIVAGVVAREAIRLDMGWGDSGPKGAIFNPRAPRPSAYGSCADCARCPADRDSRVLSHGLFIPIFLYSMDGAKTLVCDRGYKSSFSFRHLFGF